MRGFLYLLLIVLACALVFFLWRIFKRREENQVVIDSKAVPNTPDLTEDEIRADDFPVDRWLVLAKELIGKGSLRLAIRAFYLATLARLAEYEVITIASFKSNRDYEQELRRRAHEHRELQNVFSSIVKLFDRVWYGMYDVTQKDLNLCAANQERIMALAKKS